MKNKIFFLLTSEKGQQYAKVAGFLMMALALALTGTTIQPMDGAPLPI